MPPSQTFAQQQNSFSPTHSAVENVTLVSEHNMRPPPPTRPPQPLHQPPPQQQQKGEQQQQYIWQQQELRQQQLRQGQQIQQFSNLQQQQQTARLWAMHLGQQAQTASAVMHQSQQQVPYGSNIGGSKSNYDHINNAAQINRLQHAAMAHDIGSYHQAAPTGNVAQERQQYLMQQQMQGLLHSGIRQSHPFPSLERSLAGSSGSSEIPQSTGLINPPGSTVQNCTVHPLFSAANTPEKLQMAQILQQALAQGGDHQAVVEAWIQQQNALNAQQQQAGLSSALLQQQLQLLQRSSSSPFIGSAMGSPSSGVPPGFYGSIKNDLFEDEAA